jgi:AraC family transcriptional regulator
VPARHSADARRARPSRTNARSDAKWQGRSGRGRGLEGTVQGAVDDETNRDAYARRIDRVVRHICEHLAEELSLDQLSLVAGFSKFHFHRQFSEFTGFPVASFVRLTRLKRAAFQLAFDPNRRVIDIALDAGFGSPEAFSRAFKDAHGQSPTEFRRSPRWGARERDRTLPAPVSHNAMNPEIIQFEATRVATLEHRGPHDTLMQSVSRFITWRRACRDSPVATCRTFGVPHEPLDITPPEAFRFDICAELLGPLQPNDAGVIEKLIPAGRCAKVRHVGSTDALDETLHVLYGQWLPQSGEQLRDFPVFFHYVERMPTVPEHEQVTDVYLPLR